MKSRGSKLFVLLIIAIILALVGIYLKVFPNYVSRDFLITKINTGYPAQFCGIIYPHLATCVTFSAIQCKDIAKEQIQSCVRAYTSIPSLMTNTKAQQQYESYSKCFADKMHTVIMQQYMVQSPECQKTLS